MSSPQFQFPAVTDLINAALAPIIARVTALEQGGGGGVPVTDQALADELHAFENAVETAFGIPTVVPTPPTQTTVDTSGTQTTANDPGVSASNTTQNPVGPSPKF